MREVIDPEKFILEQIYRPYQTLLGFDEKTLQKIPFDNNKTIELLKEKSEWSECVIDRIRRCNFKFSKWINHPVINYLKELT